MNIEDSMAGQLAFEFYFLALHTTVSIIQPPCFSHYPRKEIFDIRNSHSSHHYLSSLQLWFGRCPFTSSCRISSRKNLFAARNHPFEVPNQITLKSHQLPPIFSVLFISKNYSRLSSFFPRLWRWDVLFPRKSNCWQYHASIGIHGNFSSMKD